MIKTPLLTVDIIIEYQGKIVLVRRMNEPHKGHYALPGGFVDVGETVENAARREAKEETGLDIDIEIVVGVYSDRDHDPRGHAVSICFVATGHGKLCAGSDAESVELFEVDYLPKLAFDHDTMVADGLRYTKNIHEMNHDGSDLWYIVLEGTNSRATLHDKQIMYQSQKLASEHAKMATIQHETNYIPMSVAVYNTTFRRFMELDKA